MNMINILLAGAIMFFLIFGRAIFGGCYTDYEMYESCLNNIGDDYCDGKNAELYYEDLIFGRNYYCVDVESRHRDMFMFLESEMDACKEVANVCKEGWFG